MRQSNPVFLPPMSAKFRYQNFHICPVCGLVVFDVYPFYDDCATCTSWAQLMFSRSSEFAVQPPLYNMGVTPPTLAVGGAE